MKTKKSGASVKSLPSSTPTSRPRTRAELENLKTIRGYGIADLKKYLLKLNQNIAVFNEAITKEKKEISRVKDMIRVLRQDIKTANKLKKFAR